MSEVLTEQMIRDAVSILGKMEPKPWRVYLHEPMASIVANIETLPNPARQYVLGVNWIRLMVMQCAGKDVLPYISTMQPLTRMIHYMSRWPHG